MNAPGANEDEMRFFTKLTERELAGILAGSATSGGLEDVATFFREMRIDLEEAPSASVESRHLAGIFEEVRHLQPPAAEPLTTAATGSRRLRTPFRLLAGRATFAAIGLAVLAAFGGAAYAGVLPTPVQDKVAGIARHVGLSLPDKHHKSRKHGGGAGSGVQHTTTLDQRPATNLGADNGTQGNDQSHGTQDGSQSNEQGSGTEGPGQGQGTGAQDNGQSNGVQGTGSRRTGGEGGQTNGDQGAKTTTDVVPTESGQGAQNAPPTPSKGSSADGSQYGDGAGNDN